MFSNLLNKQQFYMQGKTQVNSCHPEDEESKRQFEYLKQQTAAQDMRTIPGLPVPTTAFRNGKLELVDQNLSDVNYEALGNYVKNK